MEFALSAAPFSFNFDIVNTDVPFTPESVLEALRSESLRITKGRRNILKVLFEAEKPLSLQDVQDRAAAKGGAPDYATVFRTMTVLEKLGFVHKVNLQRSCSYFELQDPGKHYDHIVCRECGKVVLLDVPCPLGEAEKLIADRYGFANLTHSLEFFGRCPECAAAA